jgi:DHA1 family multidrug resistance protein-like MFS transporter
VQYLNAPSQRILTWRGLLLAGKGALRFNCSTSFLQDAGLTFTSLTPLPRPVRRRGLVVLLANTFLMWAGFFMIVPILSVHFVDGLGWAAASIGLVLALRQFLQQTLTVVSGALSDRFGAKQLIMLGLAVRTIAFAGMAHVTTLPALLVLSLLAGVGGALFDSPTGASMAALTMEDERLQFYSVRGVISSLGMTIGPLIGSALLKVDFALVAYLSASLYVVALIVTGRLLPDVKVGKSDRSLTSGVRQVVRDRPFVILVVLLMGYWFMWVQLTLSVPLKATALSGDESSVGVIYAVNAMITIALQVPLIRFLEKRLRPLPALVGGMTIMSLAMGSIALTQTFAALLLCIAGFSIGNLISTANQSTVIAGMAQPEARGSYFGMSALALALGGSAGNLIGSALYGASTANDTPAVPWLIIGGVGAVSTAGLWVLNRRRGVKAVPVEELVLE